MFRAHNWPGIALVAGAVAAVAGLYFIDPSATAVVPPCPFHYLTGLYCPGCGSMRGIHQLLHGHLAAALRLNPLMVASLPVMALLLLRPSLARRPWVAWGAFVVIMAFWILRNVPAWPFIYLAPRSC
jgi:hypothetical protein